MRIKPIIFTLLTAIILWGLLELVFSFTYIYATPELGRLAVQMLQGQDVAKYAEREPHPYQLYRNKPLLQNAEGVQHNSFGHRSNEITLERDKDTLRILVLGGSTTYGYMLPKKEQAWPNQLEELLKSKLNRKVEVINGGLNYATTAELLSQYVFRDRYFGAQVVILHTGGNDAAPLMVNNYQPDYSHFRKKVLSTLQPRPWESVMLKSSIIKTFYAFWLKNEATENVVYEPPELWELPAETIMDNAKAREPVGYRRNVEFITQDASGPGRQVVLFSFHLAPKEVFSHLKPPYDYGKKLFPAVQTALEKHRKIMQEIAQKYDALYVQLRADEAPLKDFFDHCHLTEAGERVKAERMAGTIMAMVEQNKLRF